MKRLAPKLLKLSVAGLFLNPLLIACGGQSSNPVEKYHLNSAPVTDTKSLAQTVVQPELFTISLDGTNQVNNGNFIEGEQGEAVVRVIVKSTKIAKYSIELTEFPQADRPKLKATAQPDLFILSWKPSVGIIAAGTWGMNLRAQIQVVVTESSDMTLNGMTKSQTLTLNVSRNNAQPKLLGRTDLAAGVDEGQNVPFTIDIEDPGTSGSPRLPEMQITPYIYSNTEAYRADGSRFMVQDLTKNVNPVRGDGNKWRFFYTMNVDQLPLDRDRLGKEIPNSTDVDVCFQMRAVSVIGTMSEQQQVCYKARYSVQPPVVTTDETQKEVKAGIENLITIKANTQHKLSIVGLKNTTQLLTSLSGKKEISCTPETADKQNSQICVLKWTPTCVKTPTTRTLTLKFDSLLNNKVKTATFKKVFSIQPNSEACKPAVTSQASNPTAAQKPKVKTLQGQKP